MNAQNEQQWPESLMLRDTGLSDDAGGLGQRIYTTAGAGYEKQKYVRADLAAQPAAAQEAVAYLDIGAGGYLDIGSDLPEEQLLALPNGRHALGIIGTYGIDGYVSAPVTAAPADTWFADQLTAMGEVIPLDSTPAAPGIDLADEHKGMRVDYHGLLRQVQKGLAGEPGLAEMVRQLHNHMTELGRRWYAGDRRVVDELLQLYCIESDARRALIDASPKGALNEQFGSAEGLDSPKGGSEALQIPDTEGVREILSRMCFQCIRLAQVLRLRGDEIKHRAEDEQAAVLRFLLNHYLASPDRWLELAQAEIDAIRAQASDAEVRP